MSVGAHRISDEQLLSRLEAARAVARAAGQLTLEFFQKDTLQVERKADDSPVTQADRLAEQLMREQIARRFPEDAIVGEEFGECPGSSAFSWVLDPIDGTKSFISGVPLYSVLVGVVHQARSVLGVVHIPGLDECVFAAEGHGAWHVRGQGEPRRTRVAPGLALRDGLFVTSQVDSFAQRGAAEVYAQLEQAAYITRTWGDGYGYLLVATGRAVAMVDAAMNLWDAAAIQPVIVEAGGRFSDWGGEPTIYGGDGIAANAAAAEEVLAITRPYCRRA